MEACGEEVLEDPEFEEAGGEEVWEDREFGSGLSEGGAGWFSAKGSPKLSEMSGEWR